MTNAKRGKAPCMGCGVPKRAGAADLQNRHLQSAAEGAWG